MTKRTDSEAYRAICRWFNEFPEPREITVDVGLDKTEVLCSVDWFDSILYRENLLFEPPQGIPRQSWSHSAILTFEAGLDEQMHCEGDIKANGNDLLSHAEMH